MFKLRSSLRNTLSLNLTRLCFFRWTVASGFVMCFLQLTALADNMRFWMKEWAWNYTNLSHYNDSEGRICFSFLLYLFFIIIIPRSVAMTELWWRTGRSYCWEPLSISLMQAAWAWWWFIDDQMQWTAPCECLSKSFSGGENDLVTLLFLPVISYFLFWNVNIW